MARVLIPALMLIALGIAGCATSQSSNSKQLASVEITANQAAGCEKVGDFSVEADSRAELVKAVREQASSKGANVVQMTALKVGSITHKNKGQGILLRCPEGEK
jgi:hypothetical protein